MLKFSLKRIGSNINHMYICFIPHTRWILDQVYSVTYSTHPIGYKIIPSLKKLPRDQRVSPKQNSLSFLVKIHMDTSI